MKKGFSTAYAVLCTVGLAVGFLLAFFFAWRSGVGGAVESVCGLLLGFALAPIVHELGHIALAKSKNMHCVYAKFFCFRIIDEKGKKKFGFASPFAADETQVLPKSGGDMLRRATAYTLGGLVFEGVFLALVLFVAILLSCLGHTSYLLWGIVPYAAYLFALNLLPLEYASGKTDMLVYIGLKKGYPAEKTMLSAMGIHGRLYEGTSFSEIPEDLYFELPQLPEDEPLFAVVLDLRYRYYLEKGDCEKAADQLNRLVQAQAYLSDAELEKIAAELVYMHAVNGDVERAEESGKLCREYLQGETATAKRVLAAYSVACGKTEAVEPLLKQAETALNSERIAGVRKFEKILLSRIQSV
ncbi:MAG: hypothetical protein IJZ32_01690 [Clostridia bacterium]|nr:hypothetical protein [Clostridia bacterium]